MTRQEERYAQKRAFFADKENRPSVDINNIAARMFRSDSKQARLGEA
jgi:hypothetical protein